MIIVRMRGGLGNQMFQYAACKTLALLKNTELKLDDYSYKTFGKRELELYKFSIVERLASEKEINDFLGSYKFIRYIHRRINTPFLSKFIYRQPFFHFDEDFFMIPDNAYVSGYFQSQKYFEPCKDKIRKIFWQPELLQGVNEKLMNIILSTNSVSVHIRRGDKVLNPKYAYFYGSLDIEYYKNALNKISQYFDNLKFYVFSDDISWCKQNLPGEYNYEYISNNTGKNSYLDILLMGCCNHNIIANSSFSWWGAWLNNNSGKMVIAPKKWFAKNYYNGKNKVYKSRYYSIKDLYPADWITI